MWITTTMRSTLVAVAAGTVFGGGMAFAGTTWTPPGDTITRITGTKASGFTIEHVDGSVLFPPTHTEATAECGEYDTRLARVRCRVRVRTWYDALGATKRAIRYARTH